VKLDVIYDFLHCSDEAVDIRIVKNLKLLAVLVPAIAMHAIMTMDSIAGKIRSASTFEGYQVIPKASR
jgi:hypothetical protein